MSAKAIREFDGKNLLARHLSGADGRPASFMPPARVVQVNAQSNIEALVAAHPWLLTEKLVVKPDQLLKRRGKSGLILLNATWADAKAWIDERMNKETVVASLSGILNCFIVEPFVPHAASDEYYVCIQSVRNGDEIFFYHEGGVDIGDVDAKAERFTVQTNDTLSIETIQKKLLVKAPAERRDLIARFMLALYEVYVKLNFTYLEINPFVVVGEHVYYLDLAAKLDQTSEFECARYWGKIEFPSPFGRASYPEEAYIAELDSKTGASLKLTILNERGRIWTMVAGGGASVVYSDAIAAHGFLSELANYGEYSGAPNEEQTYEYSKTILDLMTRHQHPDGKVLLIGGGIANFTNVAATFKGIIRALTQYKHQLVAHKVQIWIRRGGPNYQEGLRAMRALGESLGVPIHVHGPETFITAIVPMALGQISEMKRVTSFEAMSETERRYSTSSEARYQYLNPEDETNPPEKPTAEAAAQGKGAAGKNERGYALFSKTSQAFIYGMQPRAVQGMLDFDFMCKRAVPSVAGMIYPFGGGHVQKFYWGTQEILIPVFTKVADAVNKFPAVDHVVNFASFRSVYESTMDLLQYPSIRSIAIIAEGVPERRTKQIVQRAEEQGVIIIGPATVGGIKPGCFKIGNTGGMMDNIIDSKLYRPGSVAYVSKSGGMSNELNNIISRHTNGVYEVRAR